jgi:hypothetical protein
MSHELSHANTPSRSNKLVLASLNSSLHTGKLDARSMHQRFSATTAKC